MECHLTIFNTLSDVIAKSAFINFRGRILRDEIVWLGPPVLRDSSRLYQDAPALVSSGEFPGLFNGCNSDQPDLYLQRNLSKSHFNR